MSKARFGEQRLALPDVSGAERLLFHAMGVADPAHYLHSRHDDVARVLFLEPNDDGTVGGWHQVLLDFARHFDRRRNESVAVFYQVNVFVDRLRRAGVEVHVLADAWAREKSVMRTA